jgi:hypothetical protein
MLTYPNPIPIKNWTPNHTPSKLDKIRQTPYPSYLIQAPLGQLMRGVVRLQDTETGSEAETAEEDAETAQCV